MRRPGLGAVAPRWNALWVAGRLGVGVAFTCATWAAPGGARGATEVYRDAYWVESAVCTVVIKTPAGAGSPDPANALGALATAAASCTGNTMAQVVPGGVHTLLQRGFRITTAHHQVVLLAARADADAAMLVTGLFALERPAVKPPPIPK